jgi:hypothetical protein
MAGSDDVGGPGGGRQVGGRQVGGRQVGGGRRRPVDVDPGSGKARAYTPTALPPSRARVLAFVAILVGGLCGGLIGWSVVDLQCGSPDGAPGVAGAQDDDDGCATWSAVGALTGAVIGAGGVGVVAVLVLRAMAEWRRDLDVEALPTEAPPRSDGGPPDP